MFIRAETVSHHGTEQEIIPRFQLQPLELAKSVFDKHFEVHFGLKGKYFKGVVLELTHFYDLYHKIIALIEDYKNGVKDGKYYTTDQRGHTMFDRKNEIKIKDAVRDFFIKGKIIITNLAKAELIQDGLFDFNSFYFCDDKKFQGRKDQYLSNSDGRYLPIIYLIQKQKNELLNDFNDIRNAIEHNQFSIDEFKLILIPSGQYLLEPQLNNKDLSVKLTEYYDGILDFIEKSVVYFIGVHGDMKPHLKLYRSVKPNFKELRYKYIFRILEMNWGWETIRCNYD